MTSGEKSRFVAFLRAINVGSRRVKMDRLREIFEAMGFDNVETFIASGNVIFDAGEGDVRALETRIEPRLSDALGYEVAAFVRPVDELARVANHQPFGPLGPAENWTISVAFLAETPDEEGLARLMECSGEVDDFRVDGRKVYWLCRGRISESAFSGAVLERKIGAPATLRNATTIRRLAAKYAPR